MAFGSKPIYAVFNRDTDHEQIKEISFADFLDFLGTGYEITEKSKFRIVLTATVSGRSRNIIVYIPE